MAKKDDKRISFRVDNASYKLLEAAAKASGLTVTAFVRMAAYKATQGVRQ